ncbi:MAG: phosphatase PAP2 family protein [Acidobacteria bacterium]|nr:phosphatase PAP2 family protein [Acidobacteriota bacterium]
MTAAGAVGTFVVLACAIRRRQPGARDRALRDQIQSVRTHSGDTVATVVGPLGKEWLHGPVALGVSIQLWRQGAGIRSALPTVASAVSAIGSALFEQTTHIQKPPPGHPSPHEPSFPSGHALESSAVALTSAYVLTREGIVAPGPAFAVAIGLSLAPTAGRVYLDRHWASEAFGGWLLGIATATTCAAMYEWNHAEVAVR